MSDYFLAPALIEMRDEINELFPHRDKSSDGWIGDASHAARPSEHNPCWACTGNLHGIVRALDTDIDDGDSGRDLRRMIINAAVGDPRVWYVISNRVIYSRTHGWAPRYYGGINGHYHHVHVSLREVGNFNTAPWFPEFFSAKPVPVKVKPLPVDLSIVMSAFLRYLDGRPDGPRLHVARVQKALNQRYGTGLRIDGLVGEKTLRAWGRHEAHTDGTGRPRVPDATSLRKLVSPNFKMVA